MSNYIKPTVKLAALSSNMARSGGCTTGNSDVDIIKEWLNELDPTTQNAAFAATENCAVVIPFEGYCKFTSVEGAVTVFGS